MSDGRLGQFDLSRQDGGKHQLYRIWLERDGRGWRVGFARGTRGETLAFGYKNAKPMTLEEGKQFVGRTVDHKLRHGWKLKEGSGWGRKVDPGPVATIKREGRSVVGF